MKPSLRCSFVRGLKFGEGKREFVATEAERDDAFFTVLDCEFGYLHGWRRAELTHGVEDEF